MRDSVFEGVLLELPIEATNIDVSIVVNYTTSKGVHRERTTRTFPSKSEATFKRESARVEDDIKQIKRDVKQAIDLVRGVEDRAHKRLSKLERKNDSNATGSTDAVLGSE